MKYSGIGGQAVIEGIMMKNGDRYSTAVRKPDKTIAVMEDKYCYSYYSLKNCNYIVIINFQLNNIAEKHRQDHKNSYGCYY